MLLETMTAAVRAMVCLPIEALKCLYGLPHRLIRSLKATAFSIVVWVKHLLLQIICKSAVFKKRVKSETDGDLEIINQKPGKIGNYELVLINAVIIHN